MILHPLTDYTGNHTSHHLLPSCILEEELGRGLGCDSPAPNRGVHAESRKKPASPGHGRSFFSRLPACFLDLSGVSPENLKEYFLRLCGSVEQNYLPNRWEKSPAKGRHNKDSRNQKLQRPAAWILEHSSIAGAQPWQA